MPRSIRGRLFLAGCLAVGAAGALAAACYSDRSLGTGSVSACTAQLDPGQYGATVIAINGFAFHPASITVPVGGKVTWLNCEPAGTPSHTTTADAGAWSSTLLDPGASFTFTFTTAGTFSYHCEPHPFMTGEIKVQ
ncbi:MAG TPA: plastocyanin/azurin family copper-binding protein [Gemmatimonadales bacterium]|nr:plastocyanin/azurin family copper-binding protein [Gemmatimonadales bacterium]